MHTLHIQRSFLFYICNIYGSEKTELRIWYSKGYLHMRPDIKTRLVQKREDGVESENEKKKKVLRSSLLLFEITGTRKEVTPNKEKNSFFRI